MGKWLNGARVRKREIDGKDTRIAALAAAGAARSPGRCLWQRPGCLPRRCPRGSRDRNAAINILNEGLRLLA